MTPADRAAWRETADLLDRLHRPKDAAYGDAWCRRGEVLGIFANIARKFDRLANEIDHGISSTAESLADTTADLTVYAGKYFTWLADEAPQAVADVWDQCPPTDVAASRGAVALHELLRHLPSWADRRGSEAPLTIEAAWVLTTEQFRLIEDGLMAQADHRDPQRPLLTVPEKAAVALTLSWASAWLLIRLDQHDSAIVHVLRRDVEGME